MSKKIISNLKNIMFILLGNTIYAMAVVMFILPNNLITGGTTGLALLFFNQFGLPINLFVSFFNIAMFGLGALVLGRKFILTTMISTFYYPFILTILQKIPQLQDITSDYMLSAIYAGIMIGFAIGIVIKAGASTGGMDIPPLVLNRKFGLPVSLTMYIFDFTILMSQMLFANKEQVLYGILLVFIYTTVLDKVLMFGESKTQVKIISKKYNEINNLILEELDRGSTLIHGETGYCHDESMVILSVISNRELSKLNQIVLSTDPDAFMIVNRISEVSGRGFSLDKIHR
ncbi:MAG: YitT family protein [Proteocatella sp.]